MVTAVEMPPDCQKCDLALTRTKIVVYRGVGIDRPVCFIGEAPGADEDAVGLPFVGKSGKLLDTWIDCLHLPGYEITNVVRCRPPGNRTPTQLERDTCGEHLLHFLSYRKYKVIVALGRTSDRFLTEVGVDHMFMKHPSYYLRGNDWIDDLSELKGRIDKELTQ